MPTYLQAKQALDAALKTFAKAKSEATAQMVTRAYDDVIEALAKQPSMAKQYREAIEARVIHHEKYEKKTIESPDKKPAESGPPASGAPVSEAPETQDSEPPAAEEPESKPAEKQKDKAPKMAAPKDDEQEKALRSGYASANRRYASALTGLNIDAYGAKFGPEALLSKCMQAFNVGTVGEVFGALAAVPEKREAHTALEQRLAKLEARRTGDDIEAVIATAKAEGRTRGAEDRKELRAFGAEYGLKALKVRIADREARRTPQGSGYRQPVETADGNLGPVGELSAEAVAESHERMTKGLSPEEKAAYLAEFESAARKKAIAPAI